jgi:hypothetical protein
MKRVAIAACHPRGVTQRGQLGLERWGRWGGSAFPIPWECNMVTSAISIVTTPPPEETLMLQTVLAEPQRAVTAWSGTRLLPMRLLADQEDRRCAPQDDIECEATRWQI